MPREKLVIAGIEIDATISETHTADIEITQHPVEVGANISDHFRVKPEQLQVEGIVSNTPVTEADRNRFGATPLGEMGRAQATYEKLRGLRSSAELVSIVVGLRTYRNMKLSKLSVPRDKATGDALRFSATFDEVILVSAGRVELPASLNAGGLNNAGPTAAQPVSKKTGHDSFLKQNPIIMSTIDKGSNTLNGWVEGLGKPGETG